MKWLIRVTPAFVALMLYVTPSSVLAQATEQALGEHHNGGLGFHNVEAPLGVRWWFPGQKVGVDLGLGFGFAHAEAPPPADNEKLMRWSLDLGVPIVMKSWSRVHVLFRPGVLYTSQEIVTEDGPTPPFATDNETTLNVSAEVEAEVFLLENASVSASHGVRYTSFSPIGPGDSITSLNAFGNNYTNIGFHVYFFGGNH